jgi:hypothetical protein
VRTAPNPGTILRQRNLLLAKVGVERSNRFTRSIFQF